MKLKKGDEVIVLTGKNKGKKGKIEKIFPKKDKVVVTGVNMYKRHQKARSEREAGGIIDITRPLHISNVAFVDPKTGKPTRIGYQVSKNEKVRFAKKSGQAI